MRKCMALFLALLTLLGACSAAAEALPSGDVYSVEAADEFCNAWDQYFAEQGIPLSVGYNLAEGQDRIESFAVILNVDEEAYDYRSGLIPAESALYFQYDTTDGTYGLCVFSKLQGELEKAVIYTDDRVINNLETGNGHDGYDMWAGPADDRREERSVRRHDGRIRLPLPDDRFPAEDPAVYGQHGLAVP